VPLCGFAPPHFAVAGLCFAKPFYATAKRQLPVTLCEIKIESFGLYDELYIDRINIFGYHSYMRNIIILLTALILTGCVNVRYENSIIIDAPRSIVFAILEDFENYPNIIPEVHAEVRIITENRTGLGVQFINISTFGGHRIESIFEVTEYRFNEFIRLENISQYGVTELILDEAEYNRTLYTLINYLRIPRFMRNELFSIFDEELEIIRRISEYNFENMLE